VQGQKKKKTRRIDPTTNAIGVEIWKSEKALEGTLSMVYIKKDKNLDSKKNKKRYKTKKRIVPAKS